MANEAETSPLKMQMRHFITSGMSGLKIFEHQGHSRTLYENNAHVNEGSLNFMGITIPQEAGVVAIHKDDTKSGITKDGVAVELVRIKEPSQELIDAQMRNDQL